MAEVTNHHIKRIGYLDAARGIAACMVMIYHYTGWRYPENIYVKLSHLITNGSDAVSFFFVLSGFVLSFPYLHYGKSLDVGKFYINRIFRIYPAFIIALILNVLFSVRNDLHNSPLDTIWNVFFANKSHFWDELILIRGRSAYLGLDWTLTVEIVMSFFIPYLIAMTFHNRKLLLWFTFSTFLLSNVIGIFVLPFALGMLIAIYFDQIQSPGFKATKYYRNRGWLLLLAFVLFSIRHIDRLFPFGDKVKNTLNLLQLDFFTFTAIGSFIFLVFIIHFKNVQRFLENKILIFIGKISYGIYLMHWVIVAYIFENWTRFAALFPNEKSAWLIMLFACIAVTFLLSVAVHYWVELPFIALGKRITRKWRPTIVIAKNKDATF